MRRMRRVVVLVAALAALMAAAASPATAGPESTFLSRINASRAAAGLAPLQSSGDLAADAAAWSQHMFEAGAISHNPDLGSVTTGWESLGENVGVGPDEDTLHDAFMASPGHRQNILGDFTHVGIGVVVESDVRMWVTVIFMKAAGAPEATTTTTTAPIAAAPVAAGGALAAEEPVALQPRAAVKAERPVVARLGRPLMVPLAI